MTFILNVLLFPYNFAPYALIFLLNVPNAYESAIGCKRGVCNVEANTLETCISAILPALHCNMYLFLLPRLMKSPLHLLCTCKCMLYMSIFMFRINPICLNEFHFALIAKCSLVFIELVQPLLMVPVYNVHYKLYVGLDFLCAKYFRRLTNLLSNVQNNMYNCFLFTG